MTAHHIKYVVADKIATVTIDRAEKRNAMTYDMLAAFMGYIKEAGEDPDVHVVIVTGSGGVFCAGTDLANLQATPTENRGARPGAATRDLSRPWQIVDCPKPVIGAIDGFAVGMGAEFTLQCDVRIVTTRARFAWNFAHRGLVPDTGAGSWLLPRLIGPSRALRLLYSGDFLEAKEAYEIGYANQLVEAEALADSARAEAKRYLKSSPFSIRRIKGLVYAGLERDVAEHMKVHLAAMAECFASEDHKEGVASFLERRAPNFTGR